MEGVRANDGADKAVAEISVSNSCVTSSKLGTVRGVADFRKIEGNVNTITKLGVADPEDRRAPLLEEEGTEGEEEGE